VDNRARGGLSTSIPEKRSRRQWQPPEGRPLPRTGVTADGEGEWQTVRGKKTGRQEAAGGGVTQERVRGTPVKVVGGTGRLSVPQPGTLPPRERGEDMEEDIVRLETSDEDRYVEPY
jgi:hypothetical protein